MSFNLLALSVGNTRTRLGLFVDGKLVRTEALASESVNDIARLAAEMHAPIRDAEDAAVYLASVNDPVADRIAAATGMALAADLLRVERDLPVPIGRQLDANSGVGVDRLLNAAAAYDQLKEACVIVDAGTAVTIDFVDGTGTFHGGAILPGAAMMLRALHEQTAALPEVAFAPPDEPLGHNTEQAIRSGVYHGLRGATRELVEKFAEVYRGYPRVIATGGDAEMLFKDYELIDAIVPDLTLLGIAVTHRRAAGDEAE